MNADKNKRKKIAVAGNHTTTIDLITNLLLNGYNISCIINMDSDLSGEIAGYTNLDDLAKKNNIEIYRPFSYHLKDERDKENLLSKKIDLLLVFGWQRLIPEWFLDSLTIGAFGTHGSWRKLPWGRGRSLLNWSLILGKTKNLDNLFKYNNGADLGEIVETMRYNINIWDTISTLHHKDQLVFQLLLLRHLPQILENNFPHKKQSTRAKSTFFPKRSPDDGVIDWNWKAIDIYNLVRAVTKPYPGAFTYYEDEKIMIWKVIPFDNFPQFQKKQIGEIVANFADGTFLVKTVDSTIQVLEFDSNLWKPQIGQILKSDKNLSLVKLRNSGIW